MIIERHKRVALLFDEDFLGGDTLTKSGRKRGQKIRLAMFVKGVEY